MTTLTSELNRLFPASQESRRLGPAKNRSAIPASQSVGRRASSAAVSSSGGIAFPLTEIARTVTLNNGHYVAVESTIEDANGETGPINWLAPDSPAITII